MVVAVVEVRNVRVSVNERAVLVDMRVSAGEPIAVIVVVVFIVFVIMMLIVVVVFVVVDVLVVMDDLVMLVVVFVMGPQRHRDSHAGHDRSDNLDRRGLVTEQCPRDHRTDERSGGEDDLTTCRAEVACALDPQRDRQPVSGGAE